MPEISLRVLNAEIEKYMIEHGKVRFHSDVEAGQRRQVAKIFDHVNAAEIYAPNQHEIIEVKRQAAP